MKFATISGVGNPNLSEDYAAAVSTLYALSYAAKFASKKQLGLDYVVLPLEGLWSADDAQVFKVSDKDNYQWTMMIRQPNWLDLNTLEEASLTAARKKPDLPWEKLGFIDIHEGLSLQMLHIGSYDDEAPILADLHSNVIPQQQLEENGLHHEIYLGDPRKVAPERLKTILRQPVRRV